LRITLRLPKSDLPTLANPRFVARSQFARIRTFAKYGMTVAQVAKVYSAAIGEIERVLRQT
jgi:hypothetical protein